MAGAPPGAVQSDERTGIVTHDFAAELRVKASQEGVRLVLISVGTITDKNDYFVGAQPLEEGHQVPPGWHVAHRL
ncbi:MAG TPA: hypothetical protein PKE45_03080 [Caldilineaceae bacterium]|nr:hypothetical protein [Caldilineaceae bacterium]